MPRQTGRPRGKRIFNPETIDPLTIARLDLFNRTMVLKWVINENATEPALLLGVDPPLTFMDMASLSEHDLDNVKRMFDLAVDVARPVVQSLDKAANKMWDEGTGIPRRLYRTPPNFVYFGTPKPVIPNPNPTTEGATDADDIEHPPVPGEPGA